MDTNIIFIALLIGSLSYLLGSFSFAIIVSHSMGLPDPRKYGSQNPGATNVLRSGKKWAAFFTLLGDCLKGWVSVFVTQFLVSYYGFSPLVTASSMIGVFAGHAWPVFFVFKGGKGVATAVGILLGLNPILGLLAVSVWLAIAYFFRYSSLAALIATVFGMVSTILFFPEPIVSFTMVLIGIVLIARHKKNIINLLSGRETKIGSK